jgi:uncharacterized membrane protein
MGARMPSAVSRLCAGVAALAAALATSNARAEIKFCNQFAYKVFVAIAYPQDDGSWISRGWMSLENGECSLFDTALRLQTFYYRGESVDYRTAGRSVKMVWGAGKKFAIWENDNFNYWNAQDRVLKSTLVDFSKGADSIGEGASITVTLGPDNKSTTTISTK